MRHFGIIGNPVEQSFSAKFFMEKFEREGIDAEYTRYRCETIEDAAAVIKKLNGCNITIPHKQAVIPLLDQLDDTAQEIGAVNVVKREGTKLIGYNTDCIGFMDSIRPLLLPTDKKALILGTGGAAKAVRYGLQKLGLEVQYVSRTPRDGAIGYDQITGELLAAYTVIVNCTPLGMWPNVHGKAPIPYDFIREYHLLYDCVYNPEETEFLREGSIRGARTKNGLDMLHGQAVAAWSIWNEHIIKN